MSTDQTPRVQQRKHLAIAAALGMTVTFLPLVGNYLAFSLGHPKLSNAFLVPALWPLVIFVPFFNWLGFESIWIPHPFALVSSMAFAGTVHSLIAYVLVCGFLRLKQATRSEHRLGEEPP